MNAVTKTAPYSLYTLNRIFHGRITLFNFSLSRQSIFFTTMILAILLSAFAVVYTRGLDRQLTSQLQSFQQQFEELKIKNSQLLLEQTAWSTQARVQAIAQSHLNMQIPEQQSIQMVGL